MSPVSSKRPRATAWQAQRFFLHVHPVAKRHGLDSACANGGLCKGRGWQKFECGIPKEMEQWSLTAPRERLLVTFYVAEVAVSDGVFRKILDLATDYDEHPWRRPDRRRHQDDGGTSVSAWR